MNINLFKSIFVGLLLTVILHLSCEKLDLANRTKFSPTLAPTSIGTNSATIKGKFMDIGEGVTSYGHCWSKTTNPTINDSKTSNSGEPPKQTEFASELTGLESNTEYFVKIYAMIGSEAVYGDQISFRTNIDVQLPTVTTTIATSITETTAASGGNISNNGGSTITSRGVCWSTSQNPTIADNKTTDGTGNGSFVSSLTSLLANTTYYIRAYATNSSGTAYGAQESFTTMAPVGSPVVTTTSVSNIAQTTATSGGEVTSDGGASVIARGVCWSTSHNPTITDTKTSNGSGTGSFVSSIVGLTANTTYYVRAYATNSSGTAYGAEESFATLAAVGSPSVTTTAISGIAQTTAISGGNVTNDGGATVTSRGVCWSTSSNPTTADNKTVDGSGTGSFVSSLASLSASTIYYVRAYAINSSGTAYGAQETFTTLAPVGSPTVTTNSVSAVAQTTATCGGNVTNDGGATVTARGVCWSTTSNPTTANNKTSDGTGTGTFVSSITGLNSNTIYYVRAYATNSSGTTYGVEQSFTTVGLPSVTTTSISSITQTTATGGGNVTDNGGLTITARGVCWSTSQNPTTTDSKTSDGTGTGIFTSSITGLTTNTTYYVRAYATNSVGTAYGIQVSFTASASIPSLSTTIISAITQTTASSGGIISSDGGASVTARGVCWSTSQNPTTTDSKTSDGTGTGTFSSSITGLSASTTYYVRAYAVNSSGTAYGSQQSFTTSANVPTVSTTAISSITQITASGGGNVTSDGGASVTAKGVCWSISQNPTTADSKTSNGTGTGIFSSSITGLTANTTYYVRAYATNSAGTAYGTQQSFTTTANIPSLTTTTISSITQTTASSGGTISSDGGASVTVRGVCWSTLQNPTTADSKTSDGTGTGTFTSSITGLTASTTYYVRAYATNSSGTAYGAQQSFTTSASVTTPTVATSSISSITQTTASGGGNVTSDGGATVTARGVCWSISQNPTTTDSKTSDGTGTGTFTSSIAGLTASTTYYVRAYATNSSGTAYGAQQSFTTSASVTTPTVTTASISSITQTTATGGGNVTSDGGAAVTAKGVCWSTSQNPTTSNSKTSDGTGTGTFASSITGLTAGTTYYVRAYATNSAGTSYGSQLSFTTTTGGTLAVGDVYQGGKIAYIFQSGDLGYVPGETHGIIANGVDQSSAAVWGCKGTTISGADGIVVGTGNQNTIDIVAGCLSASSAARICSDLVDGGYSDWYLPSKDELNKLFINRAKVDMYLPSKYWSSTEADSNNAVYLDFNTGLTANDTKDTYYFVRAVRSF